MLTFSENPPGTRPSVQRRTAETEGRTKAMGKPGEIRRRKATELRRTLTFCQ